MRAIVTRGRRWRRPDPPTPADLVTGFRALLVLACAALVVPGVGGADGGWWLVSLALLAWVLDGLDGYVARRTSTVSQRGALLDSGVDGTLVLVMAVAVAGVAPWSLVGGLLWPVFVLVQVWRPSWRRTLPHRTWRKVAGGTLTGTLVIGAAPVWLEVAVQVAVGLAVAFVVWSFARDVAWLERMSNLCPETR